MIMKRFLLIAAVGLMVCSANAQNVSTMRTMPNKQEKKAVKYEVQPRKNVKRVLQKRNLKAELTIPVMNYNKSLDFKGSVVNKVLKNSQRVGEIGASYDASGTNYRTKKNESWTLTSSTLEETNEPCLVNVIPSPFSNLTEIPATYSVDSKGDVTIPAQKVATSTIEQEGGTELTLYVYLISPVTNDYNIHLTLADDGSLTPVDGYAAYCFFVEDKIAFGDNLYFSNIYTNITYSADGAAPTTMFDIDNAVLFAGQSIAGNYWKTNMAITGANAPVSLLNTSSGKATSWAWSVKEGETSLTSTDVDFQFEAVRDNEYSDLTLVGTNGENSSTYNFGFGNAKDENGAAALDGFALSGAGSQSMFQFSSTGLYSIMSRFNPDGDLAYYSNFGTPDKAGEGNSFHKIISYQGKPSAPLYITGITLPVILDSKTDDFHLEVKIYKEAEDGGLGELIASGSATATTVNAEYAETSGLTAISFPLSIEDEFEMSTDVDYVFIEDPFFIVIEGWDNGTFSATLGSQSEAGVYGAQQPSTWFTETGDENEDWYSWTGWNTSLFIGLDNATYGYLATKDNTNVTIPTTGGEAKINVEPMLIYNDDNGKPTTGLWLDNESEEAPEWLSVSIDDHYTLNSDQQLTEANFDLIFSAEALPSGVEGRQANLIFMQPGARLKVTVTQGEASGINVAVTKLDSKSAAYNLAGQRVNKDYKGLIIKDGRKFMNK